jgi:dynactin-4
MTQLQTYQFLLTVANPLFDPVRVTLATPAESPGRVKTVVTILCPEFDVGANSDVWDEALNAGGASGKRKSLMPGAGSGGSGATDDESNKQQAEAGKIWGKGRNWTSVIVEIVPGMLPSLDDIEEDEDLLEIPVFVRIEYETDAGGEEKAVTGGAGKEKREEAFWCVLGVGRIKWA